MKNIKFHILHLLKVVCFVMSFLLALISCSTEDFSTPASEPNLKVDYILALKGNQGELHQQVQESFRFMLAGQTAQQIDSVTDGLRNERVL